MIASAVGVVVLAYVQRETMLPAAGRWLNTGTKLTEPVEFVMVLGGGATTRPFVAAEMIQSGFADKILIPEFGESEEVQDGIEITEGEIIRRVLDQARIPSDAIIPLDGVVDSTRAEAQRLAEFLQSHPQARVAVVTNNFHTRRTQLLFSRACGKYAANLHVIGAPTDGYSADDWWQCEAGFLAYVNEFLKLLIAYAT